MTQVLYVAGYSRSGSTMLDMVLGAHPAIVSTGELTYLLADSGNTQRICTCGASYRDCPFWGDWVTGRSSGEAVAVRRIESRANLQALRDGRISPVDRDLYYRYARSLTEHALKRSGSTILLDSSKSAKDAAGRPIAMLKLAELDVKVLHLTRDPRATVRSYMDKGSNWVLEGYRKARLLESWRPILGWTYANRIALDLAADLGPERYLRQSYEDLMIDPAMALDRIGAFAGVDLSVVAAQVLDGDAFLAGHNVGGNRTRLKPQTVSQGAPIRPSLPPLRSVALRLVGGQVMRQLGY